jgi:hypothetical protein
MPRIRNNEDVDRLLERIDPDELGRDLQFALVTALGGRTQDHLSAEELENVYSIANPKVEAQYGIDVWDAMALLSLVHQRRESTRKDLKFDDWRKLYEVLGELAENLEVSVSLQDDYAGESEFFVECDRKVFDRYVAQLGNLPKLGHVFKVIIVEFEGNKRTGRRFETQTSQ